MISEGAEGQKTSWVGLLGYIPVTGHCPQTAGALERRVRGGVQLLQLRQDSSGNSHLFLLEQPVVPSQSGICHTDHDQRPNTSASTEIHPLRHLSALASTSTRGPSGASLVHAWKNLG